MSSLTIYELASFIAWLDSHTYLIMGARHLTETGEPINAMKVAELYLQSLKK